MPKPVSSRILKITAFILGGILLLMTIFHFWFINHAERLIEDMVHAQSDGRLRLKVDKFKFNWFSYNMELHRANFSSTDSAASTSYEFNIPRVAVRVKEIFPLVFEKRILIDSMHVYNPDIRVIRLRSKDTTASPDTGLSLPHEMGRIYNSIQDALKVLKVDRFRIDKGRFSLVNKIHPEEPPVVITDINFQLDNLLVDTTQAGNEQKILFSDNVSLHTSHQDILFPDGRHRLSFRNFRINLLNKIVEFDSCTVVATRDDSTGNSFQVFFDKLQMTNIDFAAVYHHEIIKADSVYCINPRFRLDVTIDKEKNDPALQSPRLDELIRQLTGNMQLAFVVVENASFDINTTRSGSLSSFTSDDNNFELQGLQINKYGPQPLTVEKFVMAIRNYENFLSDSTYSIQFDSILINDNRISLSNFIYKELEDGKAINNLSMPQFELQGLSWDDLVFNKQLSAKRVNLYRPVINYTVVQKKNNPRDVFQILAGIGHFMQLENLDITDGQVNLFFANNIQLHLQNADISVLGRRLVDSKKLHNIQNAVTSLHFKKGVFKIRQLTADLSDVRFSGYPDNHLQAGTMKIRNPDEIDIIARQASIRSMLINDDIQQSAINGVSWKEAEINLHTFPQRTKSSSAVFQLKDIHGENTKINIRDSSRHLTAWLQALKADELTTSSGNKIRITGLSTSGKELEYKNVYDKLQVNGFQFSDQQPSFFRNVRYSNYNSGDSIDVILPELEIVPDVTGLIDGQINTEMLKISQPQIDIRMGNSDNADDPDDAPWPETKIGRLVIDEPQLQYTRQRDEGISSLNWNGKGNSLKFIDLRTGGKTNKSLTAQSLALSLHQFSYKSAKGRSIDAGDGRLGLHLDSIRVSRNDAGAWDWRTKIRNLEANKFAMDSLGKHAGRLAIEKVKLDNLVVSSSNLLNLRDILRSNAAFRLHELTGSYHNEHHLFDWYNTGYDKYTKYFTADSFSYRPAKDLKTFVADSRNQADYLTARTGAISIGPFDIGRYAKDSVLDLGEVTIKDARLTDFRDKRVPREPGIVRSLPANLVKKIPVRLQADAVRLNNAHVVYEEVNEKTGATGKIVVEHLEGKIKGVRNYSLSDDDSLHIHATALLEGKLFTKLNLHESYIDPLGGFVMNVKMDSADLRIFNPVLKPLISAELKSGYLDSLSMQVTGREAFADGKIKMIYRDLKIRVTGNENKKQLFGGRLRSFFANTVVRNQNKKNTATVFTYRLRDRSAVNYLVKITFSGISSSIGLKKTDREARKNKILLKKAAKAK